jgi:hypothetical protein
MATGAITSIDGAGGNQTVPARVRTDVLVRERFAATNTTPPQTPNAISGASANAAVLHFSTRVALDPKTLRAYIQTVADQPTEQVVHTYPTPRSSADSSKLIILA